MRSRRKQPGNDPPERNNHKARFFYGMQIRTSAPFANTDLKYGAFTSGASSSDFCSLLFALPVDPPLGFAHSCRGIPVMAGAFSHSDYPLCSLPWIHPWALRLTLYIIVGVCLGLALVCLYLVNQLDPGVVTPQPNKGMQTRHGVIY